MSDNNFYNLESSSEEDHVEVGNVVEDVTVYGDDDKLVLSHQAAVLVVALTVLDEKSFSQSMQLVQLLSDGNRFSGFAKNAKNPQWCTELYREAVELRKTYSKTEMEASLSKLTITKDENRMEIFRAALDSAGVNACYLSADGDTLHNLSDVTANVLRVIMSDPSQLRNYVVGKSQIQLQMNAKRCAVVYNYTSPKLTPGAQMERNLIALEGFFFANASPVSLPSPKIESFVLTSDLGVSTTSGGETSAVLEDIAIQLSSSEFNAAAVFVSDTVAIGAAQMPAPKMLSLSVLDDERSPHHYEWAPSVFIPHDTHTKDHDDEWAWKSTLQSINTQASTYQKSGYPQDMPLYGTTNERRQQYVNIASIEEARIYSQSVEYDNHFIDIRSKQIVLPRYWAKRSGLRYALIFHRRGFSKAPDLADHPGRIHFIPLSLMKAAIDLSFRVYVINPSTFSLIAIPSALHNASRCVRAGSPFITSEYLAQIPSGVELKGVAFLMTLLTDYLLRHPGELPTLDAASDMLLGLFSEEHPAFSNVRALMPPGLRINRIAQYILTLLPLLYRRRGWYLVTAKQSKKAKSKWKEISTVPQDLDFLQGGLDGGNSDFSFWEVDSGGGTGFDQQQVSSSPPEISVVGDFSPPTEGSAYSI